MSAGSYADSRDEVYGTVMSRVVTPKMVFRAIGVPGFGAWELLREARFCSARAPRVRGPIGLIWAIVVHERTPAARFKRVEAGAVTLKCRRYPGTWSYFRVRSYSFDRRVEVQPT